MSKFPETVCDCGHAHGHGIDQHALGADNASKCDCHDHSHEPAQPVDPGLIAGASETRAIYRIPNMDCPMEEALIRKKLSSVRGVTGLQFNLMQRVLTVDHEPGITADIESALRAIDMTPESLDGNNEGANWSGPPFWRLFPKSLN